METKILFAPDEMTVGSVYPPRSLGRTSSRTRSGGSRMPSRKATSASSSSFCAYTASFFAASACALILCSIASRILRFSSSSGVFSLPSFSLSFSRPLLRYVIKSAIDMPFSLRKASKSLCSRRMVTCSSVRLNGKSGCLVGLPLGSVPPGSGLESAERGGSDIVKTVGAAGNGRP